MAEEFTIKLISDDVKAGLSTSGPVAGGGIGAGVALGTQVAGGFAIMGQILDVIGGVVNDLLRPIKGMLRGVFKLLGEFLRPLVDVVMLVLKPVFMLLKPLIVMFKTFMAPFMDIAKQMGIIAQQQMASGDVGGAMKTSMDAVGIIIGPFVVSLASIVLQLATTLVISSITLLINNVLGAMESAFRALPMGIGESAAEALDNAQKAITEGSNDMIADINNSIQGATVMVLGAMEEEAEKKLKEARNTLKAGYQDAMIEPPQGLLNESKTAMQTGYNELTETVQGAMTDVGISTTDALDKDKGTIVTTFKSGLDEMVSGVNIFTAKLKARADELKDYDVPKVGSSEKKASSNKRVSYSVTRGGVVIIGG